MVARSRNPILHVSGEFDWEYGLWPLGSGVTASAVVLDSSGVSHGDVEGARAVVGARGDVVVGTVVVHRGHVCEYFEYCGSVSRREGRDGVFLCG